MSNIIRALIYAVAGLWLFIAGQLYAYRYGIVCDLSACYPATVEDYQIEEGR